MRRMLLILIGIGLVLITISVIAVYFAFGPSDIDKGLVAYWSFNEGSGTVAYDSIGAYNAMIHGATYTSSREGCSDEDNDYALRFIRTEHDYVETPLDQLEEQTISFWFKVNATEEAKGIAISTHVKNDNYGNLAIGIANFDAGVAVVCIEHASSTSWSHPPMLSTGSGTNYNYNDDEWHHVVFIYEGEGNYQLFVDGLLKDIFSGTALSDDRPYIFGRLQPNQQEEGYWFNGSLDEVRIYDRVLNPSEILNLYNNPGGNQTRGFEFILVVFVFLGVVVLKKNQSYFF